MKETQIAQQSGDSLDLFVEVVRSARSIKEQYVDPRINWYEGHTRLPRWMFRLAGISTILLSVILPARAAAPFPHKTVALSAMSIAIAALTGLSSFYRWERTWRGNSAAQVTLEQHVANWELELTNARLLLGPSDRMNASSTFIGQPMTS